MKFKLIFLALIAFSIASCEKDFEEINTNPNDPVTVPSSLLLTDLLASAQNRMNSTFSGGDMGACWAQHLSKVQYNDEERYIPREGVVESVWTTLYADVVCDSKKVQELATEEGNEAMRGVALVMEAWGFGVLTDCYGNIPFTAACAAGSGEFKPVYDDQETVFTGIIAILDEANKAFDAGTGSISASSDIMYGGDTGQWKKFANALKFRTLMRISGKKDVSGGLNEAMTAGMLGSNADDAAIAYLASAPNAHPWYETVVFGTRLEWKLCQTLVDHMSGLNDPRLAVYVAPNDAGELRGKPAGIFDVPNDEYNYGNVSGIGEFYLNPELPGYFMSYAEQEFLIAEAIEKEFISGDAAAHYTNGITANCAFNGVDPAAYLAQASVNYADLGGNKLQGIAEQKWIALYSQGIEAWIERKRTGFPVLEQAIDATPGLASIPVRYTYPASEQSFNLDSYNAAVADQGENRLDTKFWWMQ